MIQTGRYRLAAPRTRPEEPQPGWAVVLPERAPAHVRGLQVHIFFSLKAWQVSKDYSLGVAVYHHNCQGADRPCF